MYHLKYKKVDNNQIRIKSKVDSMMKLKITVMPKEPLDNENGIGQPRRQPDWQ